MKRWTRSSLTYRRSSRKEAEMAIQEIALTSGRTSSGSLDRLHDLVVTVDHKKLGLMYIGTALVFLVIAGLMAVSIRLQLAFPVNTFLEPAVFNRFFTMH